MLNQKPFCEKAGLIRYIFESFIKKWHIFSQIGGGIEPTQNVSRGPLSPKTKYLGILGCFIEGKIGTKA
jgi:hypothetical protein